MAIQCALANENSFVEAFKLIAKYLSMDYEDYLYCSTEAFDSVDIQPAKINKFISNIT